MTSAQQQAGKEQGSHPLISVVIPTYNRADFVGEAIDSVLAQTWPHFELLLVDDGSTDDTQAVLAKYERDPRVRLFRQENQGQSVARNNALKEAKGDFIAFLDSDNRWLPHRLARGMEMLEAHPEVDIVYANNITIDESGKKSPSAAVMRRHSGWITRELWQDNCVTMNTTLVRRHCFDEMGGMDTTCKRADDYELWLRLSTRYRFMHIPEQVAEYRVMADQISSDKRARFQANEEILKNFQKRYPNALTPREFREGWAAFFMRKAYYLARTGNRREAAATASKAMGYLPRSKHTWYTLARTLWSGAKTKPSARG